MKARDCGIDAVGLDAALDLSFSDSDLESVAANIQRYGEIGIKVHISAAEIRCGRSGTYFQTCSIAAGESWTTEMLETQARIYSSLLQACLSQPACVSFTSNDFQDKYLPTASQSPQDPYYFDANLQPKLAWQSVLDTLNNMDRLSAAVQARLAGNLTVDDFQGLSYFYLAF